MGLSPAWMHHAAPPHLPPPQGRTFRLHRATVYATTQPWLVAGGWRPAQITVAVVVTIADLQRKREEGPLRCGTSKSPPTPPFGPLTPWPWQAVKQRSSSQKVAFWQRLSWHTYAHRCSLGSDALTGGTQVALKGPGGRTHHSRSTPGAWLYHAKAGQTQLGAEEQEGSPTGLLAAA